MLLDSLKALSGTIVEIIITRLEILSLDLEEKRVWFISILILVVFTFLFLSLGIILGVFWLMVTFWNTDRLLVMGSLIAVLLGVGFMLLVNVIFRMRDKSGIFECTIAELDKDLEVLRAHRKGSGR